MYDRTCEIDRIHKRIDDCVDSKQREQLIIRMLNQYPQGDTYRDIVIELAILYKVF